MNKSYLLNIITLFKITIRVSTLTEKGEYVTVKVVIIAI